MGLRTSTVDYPLFRMGEILVNYAEAAYELGEFSQNIADATINRLRKRANLPDMIVAEITDSFDPARDQSVPAILWEIRRERRVELMGDGFRFRDLKRWKKENISINSLLEYGQKIVITKINLKFMEEVTKVMLSFSMNLMDGWNIIIWNRYLLKSWL